MVENQGPTRDAVRLAQPERDLPELDLAHAAIRRGFRSGVRAGCDAAVFSTAIEDDNPDRLAAIRAGVRTVHRAELLAELMRDARSVAVTGTSGKSTVTGMIGWVLEQLGADPTVVNGAELVDWRREDRVGSVRRGSSDLWVYEADESDRSLLTFRPDWAVIELEDGGA